MACEEASSYIPSDQRPAWPYELWTEAIVRLSDNNQVQPSTGTTKSQTSSGALEQNQELSDENLTTKLQKNNISKVNIDQDERKQESESCQEQKLEKNNLNSTWQYKSEENVKEEAYNFDHDAEDTRTYADNNSNAEKEEEEQEEGEEVIYEPDHWSEDLDADISEFCPINTLINETALPDASKTEEAQQLKNVVTPMLQSILQDLIHLYKLFEGSFLLPVGSMAENTKVGRADEFDFAVILPVLAREEYIGLLEKENELITDPKILALLSEVWYGDLEAAASSIQVCLKELWSSKMMKHVPDNWKVLNPSGHSDTHSVAATFHLQRDSDKTMVDLDVCFWIPLDKNCLSKLSNDQFPQKHYLIQNCLDDQGLVYIVLPQDSNINFDISTVRFAMSLIERAALQQYGTDNGRQQCYRTCKCLVSALLPKMMKKAECDFCHDSLISSYCLKNIILYMTANHTEDAYWTKEKLPNRVLEVFMILSHCMKVNCFQVSAFFTPYQLSVSSKLKYDPSRKCVTKSDISWYYESDIQCVLPDLTRIKECFNDNKLSKKAVQDYEDFLTKTEWRYPEVICRVTELLINLAQVDEGDRREMVENLGWNDYGLSIHKFVGFVESVETKL